MTSNAIPRENAVILTGELQSGVEILFGALKVFGRSSNLAIGLGDFSPCAYA